MNLLADAHISAAMTQMLQRLGHACTLASELPAKMSDVEVLRLAERESRVLLTSDKDFGELVFIHGMKIPGVILLRINAATEAERTEILECAWPDVEKLLPGKFVTVTQRAVRSRPLE